MWGLSKVTSSSWEDVVCRWVTTEDDDVVSEYGTWPLCPLVIWLPSTPIVLKDRLNLWHMYSPILPSYKRCLFSKGEPDSWQQCSVSEEKNGKGAVQMWQVRRQGKRRFVPQPWQVSRDSKTQGCERVVTVHLWLREEGVGTIMCFMWIDRELNSVQVTLSMSTGREM